MLVKIALPLALALSLTACGGGDDPAAVPPASSGAPLASVPSPVATSSGAASAVPSEATLASALLTVQDFPTGWTKVPTGDEEDDDDSKGNSGKGACAEPLSAHEEKYADAENRVTAEFQPNDGSINDASIGQSIGAYASAEDLAANVAEKAAILRECGELVIEFDGNDYRGTVAETSFPKLGEETVGFTQTFDILGLELFVNQVFVRRGGLLLQFQSSDVVSNDTDQLVETMEKAFAKVERVVPA